MVVLAPSTAPAWEPITHAGLTDRALSADVLDERLRAWGLALGIYDRVALHAEALPRPEAERLNDRLARLDAALGASPDAGGSQRARGWIVAGAAVADAPESSGARHHFLDPRSGAGLDGGGAGLSLLMSGLAAADREGSVAGMFTGANFDASGMPADRWLVDAENDLGAHALLAHLAASATAERPAERAHHLARALMALGGVLHVLQDMAVPSRVRNDFAGEHLVRIGASTFERASPLERHAAMRWGRLVPAPHAPAPPQMRLAGFFHNADGTGLADFTQAGFFSRGTLPASTPLVPGTKIADLLGRVNASLPYARPRIERLDVARALAGTYLAGGGLRHLAHVRVDGVERLVFELDDACDAEYASVLLPEAAAATEALLAWLLRADIAVAPAEDGGLRVENRGAALASGTLRVVWEDASGLRRALPDIAVSLPSPHGAVLAAGVAPPDGARRIAAVFEGTDAWGEPAVAIGTLALP